ncbi:MFS general substrate transporter [Neocallimastix californiae]|uniref:MFS general substrate transporter n=1 Tax=Neocallimastix californiae TaxID=1754190 RepID=A0A1Y2E145_9FUNG|nr:MFS general substrate transporter [Neocallimastix californiae]|eukprot:ORY64585.1 MFS general substrate transporter [Neocallimastix californiae]
MDNLIKREAKKVSPRKRSFIFLNINVSCIATSMLATALTTAIPPIMEDLKISINTVQWLTSGFFLFLSVMTPFTAFLISTVRTKRLYCLATGFFIVGLTICVLSHHFWMMMIGRIIQGCGYGLLTSMAQVIILSIYPPNKIGTMMGWYGLSVGIAPIVAPTLAAVGNLGTEKFLSYLVALPLAVGIITGVFFIHRQLHLKVPFLDVRVLKNRDYTVSLLATVLVQFIFMGAVMIFPVYVQQVKGLSATISGIVNIPGSFALAVISPFAGKIYDTVGMKLLFLLGSIVLIISNLLIYFVNVHQTVWIIAFLNFFRCLSFGILLMPLVTWAMKDIPKIKTSDATALYNAIRFIGGALGSALFISVITKVANGIGRHKESPEMYGINVVFLIMAILSLIILLLGIFGCKQGLISKNNPSRDEKPNDDLKDVKEKNVTNKDNSDIEVVIKDKEMNEKTLHQHQESDINTIIDKNSNTEDSSKDKSESDTINNSKIISELDSEVDVVDVVIKDDKQQ